MNLELIPRVYGYYNILGGTVANDAAFQFEAVGTIQPAFGIVTGNELRARSIAGRGSRPAAFEVHVTGRVATPAGQNVLLELTVGDQSAGKIFGFSDSANTDSAAIQRVTVVEIDAPSSQGIKLYNRSGVGAFMAVGYCNIYIRRIR
jgi:hypothetical protein